ncbi:isocitrate/isopropylmalate dehydrogenase family protein [Jannaschia aquimarina]|uniref:3-isopropylmalate dehydrogenase n=1 Tax=Jannaschia aquimarina TaxID=935700 RepID=A0A0D1EK20_9RHOB|nr:isocitrate/isopropylmalate family dehydrogenase [Jannaschia aquimarina]KIT16165.1 3-isopropylmalate dehydrogenase [Jannaschia aquimarina]SNT36871.1 3-isopropylmalate dehydrogenase [Jannaschia aquimarina]
MSNTYRIAVFHGDGIGPEIMAPTLKLLRGLNHDFAFTDCAAGAAAYLDQGTDLPDASLEAARAADAILLSALGDPAVRFPDGTEMTPQIDIRIALDLYAGVRPVRVVPGMRTPLATDQPIDFVLIRESTEGLFHTQGKGLVERDHAEETLRLTRRTTEKVCRFAFDLAQTRKAAGHMGRVTSVDKANVFRAFAFWREIFDGVAADYPDLSADHAYVDAMALWMVTRPEAWDVMVTENMFGDILSDLGAGLMGGLGMAPSADIGDDHALFQPCHGSAPDIAGKGIANPFAMILSAGMMLDWLGLRHGDDALIRDAVRVQAAVDACLAAGEVTGDLGGSLSCAEAGAAVMARL